MRHLQEFELVHHIIYCYDYTVLYCIKLLNTMHKCCSLVIFIFHIFLRHYNPCWNLHTFILRNIPQSLSSRSPLPPPPTSPWKGSFLHHRNLLVISFFVVLNTAAAAITSTGLVLLYCLAWRYCFFHSWSRWHRCNTTSWRRENFLIINFYWWLVFTVKRFSSAEGTTGAITIRETPSYLSERVIYFFSDTAAAFAEISPAVGTPPHPLLFFFDSNNHFDFKAT